MWHTMDLPGAFAGLLHTNADRVQHILARLKKMWDAYVASSEGVAICPRVKEARADCMMNTVVVHHLMSALNAVDFKHVPDMVFVIHIKFRVQNICWCCQHLSHLFARFMSMYMQHIRMHYIINICCFL